MPLVRSLAEEEAKQRHETRCYAIRMLAEKEAKQRHAKRCHVIRMLVEEVMANEVNKHV